MQIRCNAQIDTDFRKVILASQENETPEHLALKLAAFVLFFNSNPLIDVSLKHPAIVGQEFRPDLLALNESREIKLWVECGTVTSHKLDKLTRRYRNARILVLKETLHEAETLRKTMEKHKVQGRDRVEIWAFPNQIFQEWFAAIGETTDIVGESTERSFNLVINAVPLQFDFLTV